MTGSRPSAADGQHHHVRVVARIRPLSATEQERGSKETVTAMQDSFQETNEPELIEANTVQKRWFELDAVFCPLSTQELVYTKSGARNAVCNDIFRGYNATILAYGQTGSGKTHTMGTAVRGNDVDVVQDEDGMIPRACLDLFANVQTKCDGNARVSLSYLEIYNEAIRDLLSPTDNHASLKIRETLNGEVYVSGLTSKPVTCANDVGKLMEEASKKRVVASTAMNAVSSRSHAICTLRVEGVVESNSEIQKFSSKLTLVDLAGSERIKKTGAQGSRRQEGISINKGLFVLGQVVSALSDSRKARKPPYRESQLTRLLQDSLGGNSRTIMVACVSPADFNIDESINTLRYATSARKIKSNATRNIVKNISQEEAAALRRENQLLKNEVEELRETVKRLTQSGLRMDSGMSIDVSTNASRDDDSALGTQLSSDSMEDALRISQLEKEVATLKKQLQKSQTGLQESTRDAAIELPALKVELEMLRAQVETSQQLEEENMLLSQKLQEAQSDADSARIAAAKLSAILDQLKELRRDEIDKKKEDLKYRKKDEAWVIFMEQILEGRAERMDSLSDDFGLVLKVLQNPRALSQKSEEVRSWWGGRKNATTTKDIVDPELRERVVREHMDFFAHRMSELQQDIRMESQSLKDMRESIEKDCLALQAEIGKDESKEERMNKVGQKDMLEKLKKVWSSNRSLASP